MLHHIDEEVDVHYRTYLLTINKDAKGFTTSIIVDIKQIEGVGIICKTANSVYIFAQINNIQVCEHTGFGFY